MNKYFIMEQIEKSRTLVKFNAEKLYGEKQFLPLRPRQ